MIEPSDFSSDNRYKILDFPFSNETISTIKSYKWATDLWPIVYILSHKKASSTNGTIYIGESINAVSRLSTHLKNLQKKKLSSLQIITSKLFNKSATLDIESSLISHLSGEGQYQLLNAVAGLTNHSYYQRNTYQNLFDNIWNDLREREIVNKTRIEIENSDLFKYSPYKSLTTDQHEAINQILASILSGENTSTIVNGSAGTGKTIIAIYLIRYLLTDITLLHQEIEDGVIGNEHETLISIRKKFRDLKIALVVPMASLRKTLKQVFKAIPGLKAKMVIGPYDVKKDQYDILLVDEAHRLTRFKDLGQQVKNFKDTNKILKLPEGSVQIQWILKQAKHAIFFYDKEQSIRPADIRREDFELLEKKSTNISLTSQLRVKGGGDYINFVDQLLKGEKVTAQKIDQKKYEFKLYKSLHNLRNDLIAKDKRYGLSRLMAGYDWAWKSKDDKTQVDIDIEGLGLQWNMTPYGWINSETAVKEVGCIHTTQGYDLNYGGIIFGPDIGYDPVKEQVIIYPEHYKDTSKVGELKRSGLAKDREELRRYIVNIYKTLMYRGIRGTFVYACDPNFRIYLAKHIPLAYDWSEGETSATNSSRNTSQSFAITVPLYPLSAAAGGFSQVQDVSSYEQVSLPDHITPSKDLFALRVIGESMNKRIPGGSVCLFRKYQGGSRNGKIVIVELSNYTDPDNTTSLTVKEYRSEKVVTPSGYTHKRIQLLPKSTESKYDPIELTPDMVEGMRVLGEFVEVLEAHGRD